MTDQSTSHRGKRLLIIGSTCVIIIWGIDQAESVLVLDGVRPESERDAEIRQREGRTANNDHEDQQSESRETPPSDRSGHKQQPQNVTPLKKYAESQSLQAKTNRNGKGSGIMKKKVSTMFTEAILTIYFNKLLNQSKR